ncbi:hypothetical protein B0T17DRAFT_72092 [Bombardia bombarda]|uniref:Uncharacterized protein n=1 Tax=Bombardia bombarda TaxID=252184 RepID=A0AA39XLG0_9PEZI|nr:hypothetical protein B0T17DRAFT_72092 [Bombardia bombarda]
MDQRPLQPSSLDPSGMMVMAAMLLHPCSPVSMAVPTPALPLEIGRESMTPEHHHRALHSSSLKHSVPVTGSDKTLPRDCPSYMALWLLRVINIPLRAYFVGNTVVPQRAHTISGKHHQS